MPTSELSSESSLQQVPPSSPQYHVSMSQTVTSQTASPMMSSPSSSMTSHLMSMTSSSLSSSSSLSLIPKLPTIMPKHTSETTSQPDDITYDGDDDVFDDDEFGLRTKLSPIDFSIHLHPPPSSYQPCPFPCKYKRDTSRRNKRVARARRVQRGATMTTSSGSTITTTTTTTMTQSTSNSSKWRLNSCQHEGDGDLSVKQPPRDTASRLHNDVTTTTRDVTPTTNVVTPTNSDVTSSCCDVTIDSGNSTKATDASSATVSSVFSHCNTLPLVASSRPLQQFNTLQHTKCSRFTALTGHDSTSTHIDISQCNDEDGAENDDSGTYEKLERGRVRNSVESSGYTTLRPQYTRDSVLSEASYESIAWLSMTRRHAITNYDDGNDNMSTVGDYLHPSSVHMYIIEGDDALTSHL